MLTPSLWSQGWFLWATVLVIGFPVLVIVTGEVATRLRARDSPIAGPLSWVRNVVLPAVVLTLFLRFVLEREGTALDFRLATTIVSILAMATLLSLVSAIVFSSADRDSWRGRAPRLIVDMLRIVLIAVGAAIVIGTVWGVNLGALFAALGVGGIAIGLALQDTLASLMGGIALLSERPFVVDDWIEIDGVEGRVTDINWRTVRLRTRGDDLIVIPNIVFGSQKILNNSRPDIKHVEVVPLGFSYDDPPSTVHAVITEVARSTPGVLADPPPHVRTVNYGDSSIDYEVWIHTADVDTMPLIRSEFMTRVWYAAKRHDLNIPFPIRTVHHTDARVVAERDAAIEQDRRSVALDGLVARTDSVSALDSDAQMQHFARGEVLLRQGELSSGLSLIVSGRARASVTTGGGQTRQVLDLGAGEFFGELAALGFEPNLLTVEAVTDIEVVRVPTSEVQQMVRHSERFAAEMEQVMQARRALVSRAIDVAPGVATPDGVGAR